MSVHYKFKSALDYDTVTFDGLHISVGDLKAAISQQKRIGKTSDFDLQITNAQTKEVYVDDNTLIPKNTSLLVARVPLAQQPKKQWEGSSNSQSNPHKDVAVNKGLADLSRMEGSEQDKINAMISQSTFDYDPSNYQKIRGQNQRGAVPSNYICYKCQRRGHWIKDCPAAISGDPVEIRRSTGIPRSFMVPVDGPKAPGAMMTPSGTFAVPAVDHEAYLASESAGGADTPTNAPVAPEPTIPDELICSLCRDLLTDAVMIPCCGNSFCDECIRGALLESEDHECPDCREKEIAPTTLIPNRFLRNSVSSFRNQTGYSRRAPHRPSAAPPVVEPPPAAPAQPVNGPDRPAPVNNGPAPALKPPGMETPPIIMPRIDEQRASTPTIDERRDHMSSQQVVYGRGPPPYLPAAPPPAQHYSNPSYGRAGGSFERRFPPEPYQPPPPGIKDSPNSRQEDPLEAFNRMIREKEMRARRRDEERRRALSLSRSPSRSRTPRSPRRDAARLRYSRSRSISRGRVRRSPWSPRRRRTRERTLSLTRSPSPRRRHRSPLRYRSPLRSPARSPLRSPLRSPPRSPARSPPRSPPRSPARSPLRSLAPHSPLRPLAPHSPARTPRRSAVRSPPRPLSPHRFSGVYDELLSPPRRSVEPPFGVRYPSRNSIPPPGYPPITGKPMPLMANLVLPNEPPPGYRGRYDAPPFEDIPPGVEPTVPGFEPSPFEKPVFGPPGPMERDRLPPSNYRDPYRAPYVEGSSGYRDGPIPPLQSELQGHMAEHPQRYRDNFRPTGHPYRDQGPVTYRDGQPYRDAGSQPPYRDGNFRNGPPPLFRDNNYRNNPFRDGNFRENVPHNFRDGSAPFRPPSADPRDPNPVAYHDPNYREGFREENNANREARSGYRSSTRNRGGSRRNPNEHERHRDRDGRDRERFNENREAPDRQRDVDKRSGYDKNRENRDERPREYDRNRDYEKEKDRGHDKQSPDRKQRVSPKRSRDTREGKQNESRGRSRDRESRKEKKEERTRDKSSAERSREHKEKDKKIKDRKKKKREKEKEVDKKKKRDKKDKKDKDVTKKEDDDQEKSDSKQESHELRKENIDQPAEVKTEKSETETNISKEGAEKSDSNEKVKDDLYGDEAAEAVDKEIIQNYIKTEEKDEAIENKVSDGTCKDEPFDGIELQVPADELEADIEQPNNNNNKEMLAPLPALSKWEVEDDTVEKSREPGEITSPEEEEDGGKVTSEVLKRAENAIFAKAINSLRPIEIKKISSDRLKLYGDDAHAKSSLDNIQITVPVMNPEQQQQHVDSNNKKRRYSKTPPPRLSVKERLGGKVEEVRRTREPRIVQSTVERVKSRSKTPKHEQIPYRRVTVERDRGRKPESIARIEAQKSDRRITDTGKSEENYRSNNENDYKKRHYGKIKDDMKQSTDRRDSNSHSLEKNTITPEVKTLNERERKKSVLDEAHFEPDYDENVESDNEAKADPGKKRELSRDRTFVCSNEPKKAKLDPETIKLDLTNVKKKPDSESESSSDSEYSSSSSSSDARKRKKKKKKNKKKKKRAASDSDSESDSSSDDHKKKKKKRKHKKKSSKKKKKSKHK